MFITALSLWPTRIPNNSLLNILPYLLYLHDPERRSYVGSFRHNSSRAFDIPRIDDPMTPMYNARFHNSLQNSQCYGLDTPAWLFLLRSFSRDTINILTTPSTHSSTPLSISPEISNPPSKLVALDHCPSIYLELGLPMCDSCDISFYHHPFLNSTFGCNIFYRKFAAEVHLWHCCWG